ncbi:hypothetical protein C8A05DRAFT_46692 [Staphylotrichum tortipilum]|uniref:Uncharacterized protein n=1 Tax=Staphylotrichum tortipilum TaxID=2831512 RepID=A0AAN6MFI6_9PEZI|nr:hypothetical protein C8A05DRAFT_46692 [Staphylotrichum longicolle]
MAAFLDSPDLYRILIHPDHAAAAGGATVKYFTAPNTSKSLSGSNFQMLRRARLAFDRLPAGNWIVSHLGEEHTPNPTETKGISKPHLLSTVPAPFTPAALTSLGLPSAEPLWCGTTEYVPRPTNLQCMDYTTASVIPAPEGLDAGVWWGGGVRAGSGCQGIGGRVENEAGVLRVVQEREEGLAPWVLAHVVENGERVIGFLPERVVGVREAGIADLEGCKAALGRFHALGIMKGKLSRHAFLMGEDGSVMMQGSFGFPADDPGEQERMMKAEMESLEEDARLIDPERMKLLDEFEEAHGRVLPFVFWQDSKEGGARITLTVEQHGVYRWTKKLQESAQQRFGPIVKPC